MDQNPPEHEVLATLDYDGALAKLREWEGRQVSVYATGPESDVVPLQLSAEGTLGAVQQLEQPPEVDGVTVPIGEPREGYDNCPSPSYLIIRRDAHLESRLERVTPWLAHGISTEIEFLHMDFGSDFHVQVTLLAEEPQPLGTAVTDQGDETRGGSTDGPSQ